MKYKIFIGAVFISLLFGKISNAQDSTTVPLNPHLWNSLIITSIRNPALTGLENKHQFYFDYYRPWYFNVAKDEGSFNNFDLGYDIVLKTFKDKYKVSAGGYFTVQASEVFREKSFGLNAAFAANFNNNSELSVGVSFLSFTINSIDFASVRGGNQFDGTGFNPALSGESIYDDKVSSFGPLNVGIWYKAEDFFVGFSALNLTQPDESFLHVESKSKISMYANAGYHVSFKGKSSLTPSFEYVYSAPGLHSFHPRLTYAFSKNRFIVGSYYENDAIYGLLGVDLFHHHWLINFDFGCFVNDRADGGAIQGFKVKTRVHF